MDETATASGYRLDLFLGALFGVRRMLVVASLPQSRVARLDALRSFAKRRSLAFEIINGAALKPDDVRGELEIVSIEGQSYSKRRPPEWWPSEPTVVVVDGLGADADTELLRAFLYVACLGSSFDDRANLAADKLPDGSGFVFLAGDGFPTDRFASISSYWQDEAAIFAEG